MRQALFEQLQTLGWLTHWGLRAAAILLLTLLLERGVHFLLQRLRRHAQQTANPWDEAIVGALNGPVCLAFWTVGISLAATTSIPQTEDSVRLLDATRALGLITAFTLFFLRLSKNLEVAYAHHVSHDPQLNAKWDQGTINSLGKLFRVGIFCAVALMVLQTLGVSISGLLAFGGVGGIIVGFAARDTLSNLLAGIMVFVDQPFTENDWIRSPDRDIEGTVLKIGWRVTKIQRFNMRPIFVPNNIFSSIVVENPTRMSHRRIDESIGLRYQDLPQLEPILHAFREVMVAHKQIDTERYYVFNFHRFGDSALEIKWIAFTRHLSLAEFYRLKQELLFALAEIVTTHGAEFAFPTSSIYLERPPKTPTQDVPPAPTDST